MKRHLNSLLQRKRADFDGSQDPRRAPELYRQSLAREDVLVKDGYDWLRQIHSPNHRKVVQRLRTH